MSRETALYEAMFGAVLLVLGAALVSLWALAPSLAGVPYRLFTVLVVAGGAALLVDSIARR